MNWKSQISLGLIQKKRFKGLGTLECYDGLIFPKPNHPHWEDPEDILFTNNIRKKNFVREDPASLMSSVIILLCKSDHTEETPDIQLENLNVMGVI